MKIILIALTLSLSGLSFANNSRLGQDSDPVAGDNSRCCRTGKCGESMKVCADTQIDAERSAKDTFASTKKKSSKSSQQSRQ